MREKKSTDRFSAGFGKQKQQWKEDYFPFNPGAPARLKQKQDHGNAWWTGKACSTSTKPSLQQNTKRGTKSERVFTQVQDGKESRIWDLY